MTVSELVFEEVTDELPAMLRSKVRVPCTYQDVDSVDRNPHLRDMGSCRVPAEFTITLEQWKEQQET